MLHKDLMSALQSLTLRCSFLALQLNLKSPAEQGKGLSELVLYMTERNMFSVQSVA